MRPMVGLALVVLSAGCAAPVVPDGAAGGSEPPRASASGTVRDQLTRLVIDDSPRPATPYARGEWPHWVDVDGNRCDGREDALIAQSTTRAQVDPTDCSVITGDWVSPYDGVHTTEPGELDVDHIVALENAHESGGWRWSTIERRAYANDPDVLVVVSAASNRAKGSRSPDEWRPPNRGAWCDYADRWLRTKVTFGLTATTAERDAIGEMLGTCTD